jgi:hypothetical protein
MKEKKPGLKLSIYILAILSLISCQPLSSTLTPSSTATATFDQMSSYQTSTPIPGTDILDLFPNSSTTSIQQITATFSDVKNVDEEGKVYIQDPLAKINLNVEILDQATQQPIPTGQVQYISDGNSYILIGLDTDKKYLPTGTSGIRNTSSAFFPISFKTSFSQSNFEAKPDHISQADWTDVQTTLDLIEIADAVSTFTDLFQLLSNMPSLEKHTLFYTDVCMTGPQMANLFGFETGITELALSTVLFPLSGAGLVAVAGTQEGTMLAALIAISQFDLSEDAKEFLNSQPGAYWVRFYHFGLPFDSLAVDITGTCSSPTEVAEILPPTLDFTPAQAVIEYQKAQIGMFKLTFLTFDPIVWQADLVVSASGSPVGEDVYVLHHKNYGCSLQGDLGIGQSSSRELQTDEKQIGNYTYQVEKWTDTKTGDPVVVEYFYPSISTNNVFHLALVIDNHPDECIRDAEEVIILSEADITTP